MDIDISAFQDIIEKNLNPAKLVALLRRRFGAGKYEIHVRCLIKTHFIMIVKVLTCWLSR
jgi:hypothetical protein